MNLEDCFEKRLLRMIEPDKEKAVQSIKMAEDKLRLAKEAMEKEFLDACIIYAYTSMFHSARALLYRDGIQEKSHLCIVLYLKEKYSGVIPYYLLHSLDAFRKERHEALYGLEYEATIRDAELAIKDADEFVKLAREILNAE